MHEYVLYSMPECPYCQKVLRYMKAHDINIPIINYHDEGVRDEVIRIGGKPQVPMLMIDGVPMYESDDIVEYMKKNF